MALSIKGTPQKVTAMSGNLKDVSKGTAATAAVKAAKLEEDEAKRQGGKNGGRKAR